jgi:trans-aconitate 2-methyltransferase
MTGRSRRRGGWRLCQNLWELTRYTFGDDQTALARLRLVAAAYEPVSRPFLAEQDLGEVGVALDLGCGPGFSTSLLDAVHAPRTLIGLDSSPEFVRMAQARVPRARFVVHDAAETPLPGSPADVVYARLLLAHLPDPLALAHRWMAALDPGGVLLIEDLEEIRTPPGPLQTYEEISAQVVRSGGGLMYAGPRLAALGGRLATVTVPGATAARIYLVNVERWKNEGGVAAAPETLAALVNDLRATVDGDHGATVSWVVRQIAVRV